MHKKIIISIILVILLTGCNQNNSADTLGGQIDTEWENREISATSSYGWSSPVVMDNESYFYISNKQIKSYDKQSSFERIIVELNEEKEENFLLCLHKNTLYFPNGDSFGDSIYSIDIDENGFKEIIPKKMISDAIEDESFATEIWDIKYYNNDIYLLVSGLYVIKYDIENNNSKLIAEDVRTSAFIDDTFYYTSRENSAIYTVDLENNKESIVRGISYSDYMDEKDDYEIYNQLIGFNDELYYTLNNSQIYKYCEGDNDEMIYEAYAKEGQINFIVGNDALYFDYFDNKGKKTNLYKYDTREKKVSSLTLPNELVEIGGVVDGNLFYMVEDAEGEYLPYYKCLSIKELLHEE